MNTEMINNQDSPMDEQPTTDDMVTLSTTTNTTSTNPSASASDERDRKQFTLEIHRFMAEVGKPLSKIPIMGYKELDLYQLFKEVTAHGGFNEVVKNVGTWSKIWKRLGNFDPSITDSSFRLKKNYERYLLEYEFKCFPEHRLQAMEFQEKSLKRSSSTNNFSNNSPSLSTNVSTQVARPHSPSSVSTSTTISSSSNLNSNMIQISHAGTTSTSNFISHNTSDSTTQTSPSFSRKSTLSSSTSVPNLSSLANGGSPKLLKKKRASRQPPSRSNSFNSNAPSGSPYNSPSRSNSSNNLSVLTGMAFPLHLGDLIVESLGTIIPRFPYVVNGQVYPIGFQSSRMYTSRINPEKQVKYISQIVDSGDGPEFMVTASDDPEHPIVSRESPSECWRTILQYFMETDESSEVNSEDLSVSGRMRFGLTHPEVSNLLKDLPNFNKAVESTGNLSPTTKRKYQSDDDENGQKAPKFKTYMTRSSSTTSLSRGDDIGDLETAVATLQGLKYCLVY